MDNDNINNNNILTLECLRPLTYTYKSFQRKAVTLHLLLCLFNGWNPNVTLSSRKKNKPTKYQKDGIFFLLTIKMGTMSPYYWKWEFSSIYTFLNNLIILLNSPPKSLATVTSLKQTVHLIIKHQQGNLGWTIVETL